MQQTLFFISPYWFGTPGLLVWLLMCGLWLSIIFVRDRDSFKAEIWTMLPIIVVGGIAIMFLLPNLSKPEIDPENPMGEAINRGLAIRGYGVMLMLAVLSGMGIVFYRCRKIGYPSEHIFRLAIWMIVCGMIGARLFFVIQNRDQFFRPGATLWETVQRSFDMVGGGLVVYGSMIGALLAAAFVVWKWKLPIWKTADLVAPGMALGLAIGRIGCLLNGCCWGGICDAELPSIQFPAGSPPYMQQLYTAQLLGVTSEPDPNDPLSYRVLDSGDGLGDELGLKKGDSFVVRPPDADRIRYLVGTSKADGVEIEVAGKSVPVGKLPLQSRGVHPTQIYSSINAFVLCLFLWFYWHVRKNDGEVMALMLVLYPISRFVLELIRNDESGQFGTELTISQWVSLLTVACGIGLFAWCRMFGKRNEHGEFGKPAAT